MHQSIKTRVLTLLCSHYSPLSYSHYPVLSYYLLTLSCIFLLLIHIVLSCLTTYSHCPVLSYQLLHIVLSCPTIYSHCTVFSYYIFTCPVKSYKVLTLYCLFLLHIHIVLSSLAIYSHCTVFSYYIFTLACHVLQCTHTALSCLTNYSTLSCLVLLHIVLSFICPSVPNSFSNILSPCRIQSISSLALSFLTLT